MFELAGTAAKLSIGLPDSATPHLLALDGLGDVAGGDLLREALRDGRLAHARLADEAGVVLGAPAQDLRHALDLLLAPHHRVQLALRQHKCAYFA